MQTDFPVWIVGSAKDAPVGAEIERLSGGASRNLCGRTDLAQAIDLLSCARLVVSNDSGLMHVAAALGRPLIAMFGPTEPRRTGPYGQFNSVLHHPLPCAPCMKDTCDFEKPLECLCALRPERVLERVPAALRKI